MYFQRKVRLPRVWAPILKKQPAPFFMNNGTRENGMPFKFDRKGRKRSTNSAYKSKETL